MNAATRKPTSSRNPSSSRLSRPRSLARPSPSRTGSGSRCIAPVRRNVTGERDSGRQPLGLTMRSEEHTSELQSRENLVCRLLLEKKKLDQNDPIFDSLRLDYHPDFDTWLDKVRKEHRDCYIVRTPGSDRLEALASLKIEEDQPHK